MNEHFCVCLNMPNMHKPFRLFYYFCNSVIHLMPPFPEFVKSEPCQLPFADYLISQLYLFCSLENSDDALPNHEPLAFSCFCSQNKSLEWLRVPITETVRCVKRFVLDELLFLSFSCSLFRSEHLTRS